MRIRGHILCKENERRKIRVLAYQENSATHPLRPGHRRAAGGTPRARMVASGRAQSQYAGPSYVRTYSMNKLLKNLVRPDRPDAAALRHLATADPTIPLMPRTGGR